MLVRTQIRSSSPKLSLRAKRFVFSVHQVQLRLAQHLTDQRNGRVIGQQDPYVRATLYWNSRQVGGRNMGGLS